MYEGESPDPILNKYLWFDDVRQSYHVKCPSVVKTGKRRIRQDYAALLVEPDALHETRLSHRFYECGWWWVIEALKLPTKQGCEWLTYRVNRAEESIRSYLPDEVQVVRGANGLVARSRLQNRGAHAWDDPGPRCALLKGMPNLLLVHTIADETALKRYVPAAREWLAWGEGEDYPIRSVEMRDACLADYLSYLCYEEDRGLNAGRTTVSSVTTIFPEMRNQTPLANRALQGWSRFEIQGEGAPCTWDEALAISQVMLEDGDEESADLVLLMGDAYLRQSDWRNIQGVDVSFGEQQCSVELGIAERGETTKTGSKQGVVFDYSGSARILLKYLKRRGKRRKLFSISTHHFSQAWRKASEKLKHAPGPPHSLRHLGPSYDCYIKYRTLREIQARGRWRHAQSVERYRKAYMYIKAIGRVPDHVKAKAALRRSALGDRPDRPTN